MLWLALIVALLFSLTFFIPRRRFFWRRPTIMRPLVRPGLRMRRMRRLWW
ncbi:MAG: hypothetical protein U0528_03975 [Anaerolineae bacterium]|nr:hypothetical protein [Anaerolineae bacterium]